MAKTHRLVLEMAEADVRSSADRGRRIAIAKPSGSAPPNVVWLALEPALSRTILWARTCGVFAASVPGRAGAEIAVVASVHPAVDRALYVFSGDAFEKPAYEPRIPGEHYDVHNASPSRTAFGLLQSAVVDGVPVLSPVNAVVVQPRFTADFIAVDDLYVWLGDGVVGGTAMAHVPAGAEKIAFSPGDHVRRYHYDSVAAAFQPAGERGPAGLWFSTLSDLSEDES